MSKMEIKLAVAKARALSAYEIHEINMKLAKQEKRIAELEKEIKELKESIR